MINIVNKEVLKAFKYIQKGGVILYPTDTIWGIGCDATNCKAVEKIYRIKKRKINSKNYFFLSKNNNLIKAARNLYPLIRKIKNKGYKKIAVEKIPNIGIGKTINDRLERASKY